MSWVLFLALSVVSPCENSSVLFYAALLGHDFVDITSYRQTSRRLCDATELRFVWAALAAEYCSRHLNHPRPPPESFGTNELRQWVTERYTIDKVWKEPITRPHLVDLTCPGDPFVAAIVPGGRWVLIGNSQGFIHAYDLCSEDLRPLPLIAPQRNVRGTSQPVETIAISVDPESPTLQFTAAFTRQGSTFGRSDLDPTIPDPDTVQYEQSPNPPYLENAPLCDHIWFYPITNGCHLGYSPLYFDGADYRQVISTYNGIIGVVTPTSKDEVPTVLKLVDLHLKASPVYGLGLYKGYAALEGGGVRFGYSWDRAPLAGPTYYNGREGKLVPFDHWPDIAFDEETGRFVRISPRQTILVDFMPTDVHNR